MISFYSGFAAGGGYGGYPVSNTMGYAPMAAIADYCYYSGMSSAGYGGYSYPGYGNYSSAPRFMSSFWGGFGGAGFACASWAGPQGMYSYMGYGPSYGYGSYGNNYEGYRPYDPDFYSRSSGGAGDTGDSVGRTRYEDDEGVDREERSSKADKKKPKKANWDADAKKKAAALASFINRGAGNGLRKVKVDTAQGEIYILPYESYGDLKDPHQKADYARRVHAFFSKPSNKKKFEELVGALPDGTTLVLGPNNSRLGKSRPIHEIYAAIEGWNPQTESGKKLDVMAVAPNVRYFVESHSGNGKSAHKPMMSVTPVEGSPSFQIHLKYDSSLVANDIDPTELKFIAFYNAIRKGIEAHDFAIIISSGELAVQHLRRLTPEKFAEFLRYYITPSGHVSPTEESAEAGSEGGSDSGSGETVAGSVDAGENIDSVPSGGDSSELALEPEPVDGLAEAWAVGGFGNVDIAPYMPYLKGIGAAQVTITLDVWNKSWYTLDSLEHALGDDIVAITEELQQIAGFETYRFEDLSHYNLEQLRSMKAIVDRYLKRANALELPAQETMPPATITVGGEANDWQRRYQEVKKRRETLIGKLNIRTRELDAGIQELETREVVSESFAEDPVLAVSGIMETPVPPRPASEAVTLKILSSRWRQVQASPNKESHMRLIGDIDVHMQSHLLTSENISGAQALLGEVRRAYADDYILGEGQMWLLDVDRSQILRRAQDGVDYAQLERYVEIKREQYISVLQGHEIKGKLGQARLDREIEAFLKAGLSFAQAFEMLDVWFDNIESIESAEGFLATDEAVLIHLEALGFTGSATDVQGRIDERLRIADTEEKLHTIIENINQMLLIYEPLSIPGRRALLPVAMDASEIDWFKKSAEYTGRKDQLLSILRGAKLRAEASLHESSSEIRTGSLQLKKHWQGLVRRYGLRGVIIPDEHFHGLISSMGLERAKTTLGRWAENISLIKKAEISLNDKKYLAGLRQICRSKSINVSEMIAHAFETAKDKSAVLALKKRLEAFAKKYSDISLPANAVFLPASVEWSDRLSACTEKRGQYQDQLSQISEKADARLAALGVERTGPEDREERSIIDTSIIAEELITRYSWLSSDEISTIREKAGEGIPQKQLLEYVIGRYKAYIGDLSSIDSKRVLTDIALKDLARALMAKGVKLNQAKGIAREIVEKKEKLELAKRYLKDEGLKRTLGKLGVLTAGDKSYQQSLTGHIENLVSREDLVAFQRGLRTLRTGYESKIVIPETIIALDVDISFLGLSEDITECSAKKSEVLAMIDRALSQVGIKIAELQAAETPSVALLDSLESDMPAHEDEAESETVSSITLDTLMSKDGVTVHDYQVSFRLDEATGSDYSGYNSFRTNLDEKIQELCSTHGITARELRILTDPNADSGEREELVEDGKLAKAKAFADDLFRWVGGKDGIGLWYQRKKSTDPVDLNAWNHDISQGFGNVRDIIQARSGVCIDKTNVLIAVFAKAGIRLDPFRVNDKLAFFDEMETHVAPAVSWPDGFTVFYDSNNSQLHPNYEQTQRLSMDKYVASVYLGRTKSLHSKRLLVYNKKGEYEEDSDFNRGLRLAEEAYRLNPNDEWANFNLATTYSARAIVAGSMAGSHRVRRSNLKKDELKFRRLAVKHYLQVGRLVGLSIPDPSRRPVIYKHEMGRQVLEGVDRTKRNMGLRANVKRLLRLVRGSEGEKQELQKLARDVLRSVGSDRLILSPILGRMKELKMDIELAQLRRPIETALVGKMRHVQTRLRILKPDIAGDRQKKRDYKKLEREFRFLEKWQAQIPSLCGQDVIVARGK